MYTQLCRLTVTIAVLMTLTKPVWGQGPVVLGGDDLTDHGSITNGVLQNGWKYIQLALVDIHSKVSRANDQSVAALGSAPSTATRGDAGAGIAYASADAGLSVAHYDGVSEINAFFANLASGATNPAIIWIAGTDAVNDLDVAEGSALAAHAADIARFVNEGGGLMSHGTGDITYGWLYALFPELEDITSGATGDLLLTPTGMNVLPSLTNAEINVGPWHNHFEGNLAQLKVLVRSGTVMDTLGDSAAVIIGGDSVVFQDHPEECDQPCIPCLLQWLIIILIVILLIVIWLTLRAILTVLRQGN